MGGGEGGRIRTCPFICSVKLGGMSMRGGGSAQDVRVVRGVENGSLIDAEGGLGDDRLDNGAHNGEEENEQQRYAEGDNDELREPEPFLLVEWDFGRSSSTIRGRVVLLSDVSPPAGGAALAGRVSVVASASPRRTRTCERSLWLRVQRVAALLATLAGHLVDVAAPTRGRVHGGEGGY